jgi:cyclin-dependent kinase regulatory subunit CKS1
MPHYPDEIEYSDKYQDDAFEYRHVILPKRVAKEMFKLFHSSDQKVGSKPGEPRLLSENEWRAIGVQQSRGWHHYEIHKPEPHILLFRRPLGTNPVTGLVEAAAATSKAA